MSGQYMMHGASGSLDTFCTRPPTLIARPDGVSSGYGLLARGPMLPVPGTPMLPAPGTPRGRGEGGGGASAPGELCVRSAGKGLGVEKPALAEAETAKRGERRAMGGAR